MDLDNFHQTNTPLIGRIIPSLVLPGHQQMAIDAMLLEGTLEKELPIPSLRFYRWEKPCLSIGRNQLKWPKRWNDLSAKGEITLVRRPTGGSAVLHGSGLTYALILPKAPKGKQKAYQLACEWLQKGFKAKGFPLQFGNEPIRNIGSNCFSTSSTADLIDKNGFKRIGNAQLWKKGSLLQHGEILLNPPQDLWEMVFHSSPPASATMEINTTDLEESLKDSLIKSWDETTWEEKPLTKKELDQAKESSSAYQI